MQPYQEASEEIKRQQSVPGNAIRSVASVGAGIAGSGAILSKVLPFLNKFIPEKIAIAGITKLNPKIGKFISSALGSGYEKEELSDFIKEKMGIEKEEKQKPNELGNASKELHAFVEQEIQGGKSPEHAAASAYAKPQFADIIKEIEKEKGVQFHRFIQQLYEGKAVQSQSQPDQMMGQPSAPQQMQQAPQQGGQGQQALMSILQKIQQSRGQQP